MSRLRVISKAERASLADAIIDMRRAGIRPRELIAIGIPRSRLRKIRVDVLAARFAAKAVRP